jgi:LmbE family N-acetylglucosaminyl deacetylase
MVHDHPASGTLGETMSEFGGSAAAQFPARPHIVPLVHSSAWPRRTTSLLLPYTVDLTRHDAMSQFRERTLAVLSPHFDDACFSLGSFLAAAGHGTLINIFTQGIDMSAADWRNQTAIYDVREAENLAFCLRAGLESHDLGCEQPELRGRRARHMTHIADDLAQIEKPVLRTLNKISAGFAPKERGILFAPLGITGHANHRATTELVLRNLAKIRERFDVMLYEEQPGARSLARRAAALRRVAGRLAAGLSARFVRGSPWSEKRALLALYPSWLRTSPRRSQFWPRAARPLGPHEAFWAIAQNQLRPLGE